jgi:hypothetical protein
MLKFLLLMMILMNFLPCVNGYTNYVSYNRPVDLKKVNCPGEYNKRLKVIESKPKKLQPYGYIKNKYLERIRFRISDMIIGTDPDFFSNI